MLEDRLTYFYVLRHFGIVSEPPFFCEFFHVKFSPLLRSFITVKALSGSFGVGSVSLLLNCVFFYGCFSEKADLLASIDWKGDLLVKLLLKGFSCAISLLDKPWIELVALNILLKMFASLFVFVLLIIRLHKIIGIISLLFYVEIVFDCRLENFRWQFLRIDVCHKSSP